MVLHLLCQSCLVDLGHRHLRRRELDVLLVGALQHADSLEGRLLGRRGLLRADVFDSDMVEHLGEGRLVHAALDSLLRRRLLGLWCNNLRVAEVMSRRGGWLLVRKDLFDVWLLCIWRQSFSKGLLDRIAT